MKKINYVPILKWKQGEYTALKELYPQDKALLTPIAEVVPIPTVYDETRDPVELDAHVSKLPRQMEAHWGTEDPIWIDSWLLDSPILQDGSHVLEWIMDELRSLNVKAIPVAWTSYDSQTMQVIKTAVQKDGRGVCIRLDEAAGDEPDLTQLLDSTLAKLELHPEDVDLVLDVGSVGAAEIDRAVISCRHLLNQLPHINQWRTLVLAASGFPENMSGQGVGISTIQRADWLMWERVSQDYHNRRLERLPLYGDYAIAHPEIADLDPRTMQMSANIRYTSEDTWVIFKGRGVKKYGFEQIFGLCQQLIAHPCYRGAGFSFGDEIYSKRANKTESVGNASQWRRDATNHHLTFVVRQLQQGQAPNYVA
ncbi:beta family protein [Halomonas sp. 7T]|uniref:beta family protein n=1 Tax=Halomonas sp. 7T TaxID=2893469 RepID=UPI0021D7E0E4|nr:beta family protein [Halomonas sp. 7T]UXZ55821.1 beta family protein [Halomonas sp. 7T]